MYTRINRGLDSLVDSVSWRSAGVCHVLDIHLCSESVVESRLHISNADCTTVIESIDTPNDP